MPLEYEGETGLVLDERGISIAAMTKPRRDELGPKFAAAEEMFDACVAARDALRDYLDLERDETFEEVFGLLEGAIAKAIGNPSASTQPPGSSGKGAHGARGALREAFAEVETVLARARTRLVTGTAAPAVRTPRVEVQQ